MVPCALWCAAALAALSASLAYPVPAAVNNYPTIGILTIPIASAEDGCVTAAVAQYGYADPAASCFSAFYVKWLESAGARVVLLPYNANATLMTQLLDSVNGVLFTGGGLENLTWTTPYMTAAARVLDYVQRQNDAGVFMPLHGTCQGMQVLSLLAAQNQSVLIENAFQSENISLPLLFDPVGLAETRMFGQAPRDVIDILATQNVTLNLHHDGVPPAAYAGNSNLSAFFSLVSTNVDRVGKAFVSTLEAREYPITATQWHPERPQFEWRNEDIPHTWAAVSANSYVANFFVNDARRNNHTFDPGLAAYSIYSYTPGHAADILSGYQYYIFVL